MASPAINDCVVCSKPASLRCEHIDKDRTESTTWYCGKECQTSDWLKHQKGCNGSKRRKQLYQAGDLIQDIFYQFREIVYDIPLSKVGEDAKGKLHLYEGEKLAGETMARFPALSGFDEKDKGAVLSYNACDEALILMFPLLKKTLEGEFDSGGKTADGQLTVAGISTKIEEISFGVTNDEHRIVFHHLNKSDNGDKPSHTVIKTVHCPAEVLKIRLKDGNDYVVDLAGAQYGQYKAVVSWDEFRAGKLSSAKAPPMGATKFGFHADLRENQILGKRPPFKPTAHDSVMMQLMTQKMDPRVKPSGDVKSFAIMDVAKGAMMKDIERWETSKQITLVQMLKEKPQKFAELKADLVNMIRGRLITGMDRGERKGRNFDSIQPEPYRARIEAPGADSIAKLKELSKMLGKDEKKEDNMASRKEGESMEEWAKRLNALKTGGWDDGLKILTGDDAEKMLADKEKMAELAKTGGGVFEFDY